MKKLFLLIIIVAAALYVGSTYYYYSPLHQKNTYATAVMYPTKGNTTAGIITFAQHKDGLHITAQITGLTPGKHGFHVHEFGNCACDDAVCAGEHFNPTHKPHGGPEAIERHVGDFGNIIADENGNGSYNAVDSQAQLNGPHSIIGRGIIIHAQEDDFETQPTGNAGARVACGVVGIAKKQ